MVLVGSRVVVTSFANLHVVAPSVKLLMTADGQTDTAGELTLTPPVASGFTSNANPVCTTVRIFVKPWFASWVAGSAPACSTKTQRFSELFHCPTFVKLAISCQALFLKPFAFITTQKPGHQSGGG
jgi:hypothetical protein